MVVFKYSRNIFFFGTLIQLRSSLAKMISEKFEVFFKISLREKWVRIDPIKYLE